MQGDICSKHASDLKENVRTLLNNKDMDILPKLGLVNSLQRLGVCYHFEDEITKTLQAIFNNDDDWENQDLYAISLKFRLLRQHKFRVPQGTILFSLLLVILLYVLDEYSTSCFSLLIML